MFMEPVFVPRHNSAAEDDGWLMAYAYDTRTESSDVVILEAGDLDENLVRRRKSWLGKHD